MVNKVTSLTEAVSLVKPGDTIALGGMTLYRRPVAMVKALIRSGIRDLTLMALTAGYESDLLVGAGCVSRVRTCYFGLEIFGLAPMFTQRASQLEVVEETEVSLAFGLRATLSGISYLPAKAWLGTDLLKVRPDVKTVRCPYTHEKYVAFPRLVPDVAIVHVQEAEPSGTAVIVGNLALDREMILAAKRVILTTERLVEEVSGEIGAMSVCVDAVVDAPGGARPTSCYPDYSLEGQEIADYIEACNEGRFEEYLERFLEEGDGGLHGR